VPRLLVIDDDPAILLVFRRAFADSEVLLRTAATAREGLEAVAEHRPDVVLLDVHLPDRTGLELYREIRQLDGTLPVIFITASGSSDMVIEAMKLGAYDYLPKPLDLGGVRELLARAFEVRRLMHVPVEFHAEHGIGDERADVLIGGSPSMREVYKAIGRVAPRDVTVLIRGESGTGKELVARAIYQHSPRVGGPFLPINCAAIPDALLESELFGHEKGAFTGADRQRIGKFEQCSGGTLFLDEIGDMPPLLQTKMLRVLQEQRFERVGGDRTIETDVRIIAATHQDLERLIAERRFRADLYYRLQVFTIALPPLRDRPDDILLLIDHYLKRLGPELHRRVERVAPEALELLLTYRWPGNVRELEGTLKQALLRATAPVLVPNDFPDGIRNLEPANVARAPTDSAPDIAAFLGARLAAGTEDLYAEFQAFVERYLITQVLHHARGNQARAAQTLGIARNSLRKKIRLLGITIDRVVGSGEADPESDNDDE
jgi:two-component system nitrogen regulation response regulator GlnG